DGDRLPLKSFSDLVLQVRRHLMRIDVHLHRHLARMIESNGRTLIFGTLLQPSVHFLPQRFELVHFGLHFTPLAVGFLRSYFTLSDSFYADKRDSTSGISLTATGARHVNRRKSSGCPV